MKKIFFKNLKLKKWIDGLESENKYFVFTGYEEKTETKNLNKVKKERS